MLLVLVETAANFSADYVDKDTFMASYHIWIQLKQVRSHSFYYSCKLVQAMHKLEFQSTLYGFSFNPPARRVPTVPFTDESVLTVQSHALDIKPPMPTDPQSPSFLACVLCSPCMHASMHTSSNPTDLTGQRRLLVDGVRWVGGPHNICGVGGWTRTQDPRDSILMDPMDPRLAGTPCRTF